MTRCSKENLCILFLILSIVFILPGCSQNRIESESFSSPTQDISKLAVLLVQNGGTDFLPEEFGEVFENNLKSCGIDTKVASISRGQTIHLQQHPNALMKIYGQSERTMTSLLEGKPRIYELRLGLELSNPDNKQKIWAANLRYRPRIRPEVFSFDAPSNSNMLEASELSHLIIDKMAEDKIIGSCGQK